MLNIVNKFCHIILRISFIDLQITGICGFIYKKTSKTVIQSSVLQILTFIIHTSFALAYILLSSQVKSADWKSVRSTTFIFVTLISSNIMMFLVQSALCRFMITQKDLICTVNSVSSILRKLSSRGGDNIFDTEFLCFLLFKLFLNLIQGVLQIHLMILTISQGNVRGFINCIIISYIEHTGFSILNVSFLFMISIGQCFKLCAKDIQKNLQELDGRLMQSWQKGARIEVLCRTSDDLDEIMGLWNSAYQIYTEVQTTFSYQNLVIMFCSYWDSVLQFYHAFAANTDEASHREDHSFLQELLFGLCAFSQLALFILAASSAFELSRRVRLYLEGMLDLHDVDGRLLRNVSGQCIDPPGFITLMY